MPTPESDATLVRRARQGHKTAFAELVLRYRRQVLAIAYRMTGSPAAAEDIAQEAFVRAWMGLDGLRDPQAFRAWLCRLAVNAAHDALRRTPELAALAGDEPDGRPSPEQRTLVRERAEAVRRAVLDLPEQCRAALILREFEGLAYREIAQALDIPLGTVMSRLHYARRLLRTALDPYLTATEER